MEFYIIIALLAAVIVLLTVLILKQGKNKSESLEHKLDSLSEKTSELNRSLGAEFERSRRETASNLHNMRIETSSRLTEMGEKVENIRVNNLEQNAKQSRVLSEAVDRMRESNEKKLEQMRVTVDEKLNETLSQRLDSSFKTVSDRLENVYKSLGEMKELSAGVTDNVTALNRVLTNVKARGTWAEVQLGAILDQTIPGMYETNFVCVPGSKDRVEFAVRIPSSDGEKITYLPIDSKFPMEDYIRLCDAADSADAEALAAARKALEARVVNEAKTVSKYINVPTTTPFAIMYLASEGLYAEIAASQSGLPERLQSEFNIMIAGPSTITALLNSLALGFRIAAINEKATEVRKILSAVKSQYDTFSGVLAKAKKKVDEAGKTLEDAERKNLYIRRKLKNVEEIDASAADKLLFDGLIDDTDEE